MSSEEEIQNIIIQLQRLQIRQSELLTQLEGISEANLTRVAPRTVPRARELNNPTNFVIGDRVRILNPGILQTATGTVIKIGEKQISIQTRTGIRHRLPKNITLDN
jgi:hypothetical protein